MAEPVILFANNASALLAGDISSTQTSLQLSSSGGDAFPSPVSGQIFKIALEDQQNGQFEICDVTAKSNDVLTVVRGAENTTPQAFRANYTIVQLRLTKETMERSFETTQGEVGPMGVQGIPGATSVPTISSADAVRDFVAADMGKKILYTSADAGDVWTMQADTGQVGDKFWVCNRSNPVQTLTINAGVGVTFRPVGSASSSSETLTTINEQLEFHQISTDEWHVT